MLVSQIILAIFGALITIIALVLITAIMEGRLELYKWGLIYHSRPRRDDHRRLRSGKRRPPG